MLYVQKVGRELVSLGMRSGDVGHPDDANLSAAVLHAAAWLAGPGHDAPSVPGFPDGVRLCSPRYAAAAVGAGAAYWSSSGRTCKIVRRPAAANCSSSSYVLSRTTSQVKHADSRNVCTVRDRPGRMMISRGAVLLQQSAPDDQRRSAAPWRWRKRWTCDADAHVTP